MKFAIVDAGDCKIVQYEDGSCHPANDDEIAMWEKIQELVKATESLACFWYFVRAGAELDEHVIAPDDVVLSYMGHGGSTYVFAKDFDALIKSRNIKEIGNGTQSKDSLD